MFLVLVGGDEDDFQFVLMLGRLFEPAVKVAQAAIELLARCVQAAAEEEADQRELGAQRLHVHLGFLAVDEPLPEQAHQELPRHHGGSAATVLEHKKQKKKSSAETPVIHVIRRRPAHTRHLQSEGFCVKIRPVPLPLREAVVALRCGAARASPRLVLRCERCAGMRSA